MGQTIELLENALRAWEDICLVDEARIRTGIVSGLRRPESYRGPPKHWRELRNHLLMLEAGGFDTERFLPVGIEENHSDMLHGLKDLFRTLPLQLASWVVGSRRVFTLSDELVNRFLAASYSKYKWSDLLWPFDSFAIDFESPVIVTDGNNDKLEVSLLLVTSFYNVCGEKLFTDKEGFESNSFVTAFNDRAYATQFLPTKERERLDDDVRHKRWMKVNKRLLRMTDVLGDLAQKGHLRLPPGSTDPNAATKDEYILDGSSVSRIIAGLCLYLEALPPGTVDAYQWHQQQPIKARREVRKIITDGEQICRVEDFHTLSPETMTLFPETLNKGPAHTVTPHWRRKHYRRRKGQGNNPNAPRDVEVRSALIHKDQLPEGALPGGATSHVK